MAKSPTLSIVSTGWLSSTQINQNFQDIETAFENTISRDGSTPNTMEADFDLNGYDLLNVGSLDADSLTVAGTDLTASVASAATSAASAATSASEAASSAAAAAASATLASLTPDWKGAWVTSTAYELGDLVSQSGSTYICVVAHTSGTFSTDFSTNAYWELFSSIGASGGGTGDMLAANNLSDLDNVVTARGNLGVPSKSGAETISGNWTITGNEFKFQEQSPLYWGTGASSYSFGIWSANNIDPASNKTYLTDKTGKFYLMTTGVVEVRDENQVKVAASFNPDGETSLSYNNGVKLQTLSNGVEVTGVLRATSAGGSWFADEDDMASNSPSKVCSQQSIKAYVDSKVGVARTWQDMLGSRSANTSYQNTTGYEIVVNAAFNVSSTRYLQVSSDGTNWVNVGVVTVGGGHDHTFVVPNNHYYRLNGTVPSIVIWSELR